MNAVQLYNVNKTFRLYGKPINRLKEIIFRRPYHKKFEALKNISFRVEQGETIGIIGDNGSGKSTLLKVISGILPINEGTLLTSGRTSALLELGAGFHQEFTGRQNIYLNASLFGLGNEEIEQKEPEIIEFSDLDDFIDRPVKIYSSGMYVRLAFAIATSINPDILIVDEALSVGDQRFQKKSIERMIQFRDQGKTIIFCSHSPYLVSELCNRAIWIHKGEIMEIGGTERVINSYEKWCLRKDQEQELDQKRNSPILIKKVQVLDNQRKELRTAKRDDDLVVSIEMYSRRATEIHIGVGFQKISGESIFGVNTRSDLLSSLVVEGAKTIEVSFPKIQLISGSYQVFGVILDEHALHVYDLKLSPEFDIEKTSSEYGFVFMEHIWKTNQLWS